MLVNKSFVNNKIYDKNTASSQTNMSPMHSTKSYNQQK